MMIIALISVNSTAKIRVQSHLKTIWRRHMYHSDKPASAKRAIAVAMAAPMTPSSGNPNKPKINSAFNTVFNTIVNTDIHSNGLVMPTTRRLLEIAIEIAKPNRPHRMIEM